MGHDELFDDCGIINAMISNNRVSSLILYGPAGCGKTTIARNLAKIGSYYCEILLATNVTSSILRKLFEDAKNRKNFEKRDTILIIDEIHYLNRSQQDLFLPFIEDGTIILIGATTQNPSFELNSALLSRCRIITLQALDEDSLLKIIDKCEEYKCRKLPINSDLKKKWSNYAAAMPDILLIYVKNYLVIK